MRKLNILLLLILLLAASSCGGGSSSGPQVVSGIIIEAPTTALRGSLLTIIPRAQLSSASSVAASLPPKNGSTTLIPPRITVTVEHGSLLDINGSPVSSLTVDTGTEVRWQLPDSVGTYVVRGSYESFSTSATVLTTDPANGLL